MKSLLFHSIIIYIQLFVSVHSQIANENKELNTFTYILPKYKNITNWEDTKYYDEVAPLIIDGESFKKSRLLKVDTSSATYFRNQLSSYEKVIYDALKKICTGTISTLEVKISNLESYNVKISNLIKYNTRAFGSLMVDHPEFWWIKSFDGSYSPGGSDTVSGLYIKINTEYSISDINKLNKKVLDKAQTIANNADKETTLYKKLLYIHDYLVKNIKYDENFSNNFESGNIYGALINNKCGCEGYSEAFAYISRLVGAKVIIVASQNHEWNFVNIDNKWYAVDVTWDDPINNTSQLYHDYFLVGSNTIIDKTSKKRYKDEKERKLVNYLVFETAVGFTYPTLSSNTYENSTNNSGNESGNTKGGDGDTNSRCGPKFNNKNCPYGKCCSAEGYCGTSTSHCYKGCQSEFGYCFPTAKDECGIGKGTCPEGSCCSKYGWCGKTEEYCGTGCQSEFGDCNTPSQKESKLPTSTNQCGPNVAICGNDLCCSKYGWCGSSNEYCGTGCQKGFGKCL